MSDDLIEEELADAVARYPPRPHHSNARTNTNPFVPIIVQ
jgi:hypothetical protein